MKTWKLEYRTIRDSNWIHLKSIHKGRFIIDSKDKVDQIIFAWNKFKIPELEYRVTIEDK